MIESSAARITKLTGVYHADGGLLGELRYVVGKLRGQAHCALCDITHGRLREKPRFAAWRAALPVTLELVHLNERDESVARVTGSRTPALVAHTDAGALIVLLGPDELELDGSLTRFEGALADAIAARGLRWPEDPVDSRARGAEPP